MSKQDQEKRVISIYAQNGTGKTRLVNELAGVDLCNQQHDKVPVARVREITCEKEKEELQRNSEKSWKERILENEKAEKIILLNKFFCFSNILNWEDEVGNLSFCYILQKHIDSTDGDKYQEINKKIEEKMEKKGVMGIKKISINKIPENGFVDGMTAIAEGPLDNYAVVHTGAFGKCGHLLMFCFVIELLSSLKKQKIDAFLSGESWNSVRNNTDSEEAQQCYSYIKALHQEVPCIFDFLKKEYELLIRESERMSFDLKRMLERNKSFKTIFKIVKERLKNVFQNSIDVSIKDLFFSTWGVDVLSLVVNTNGVEHPLHDFMTNKGSQGERKVLSFMMMLVKILSMEKNKEYLILADDIFDSSDQSRYARMLEVLGSAMADTDAKFMFVHFTHNYELFKKFNHVFREIDKDYRSNIYLMSKGTTTINETYQSLVFENFPVLNDYYLKYTHEMLGDALKNKNYTKIAKLLIAQIPRVRDVVEQYEGNGEKYTRLTSLLHFKGPETSVEMFKRVIYENDFCFGVKDRSYNDFIGWLEDFKNDYMCLLECVFQEKSEVIPIGVKKIIENYAKSVGCECTQNQPIKQPEKINLFTLEDKQVMAIYARFLIEKKIIEALDITDLNSIKAPQTGELIRRYREGKGEDYEGYKSQMKELNSSLVEYIHTIDAFPYLMSLNAEDLKTKIENFKDLDLSKVIKKSS